MYNKACALSMLRQGKEALDWLGRAVARDGKYKQEARTDPDFPFIREHTDFGPRFRELVGEWRTTRHRT